MQLGASIFFLFGIYFVMPIPLVVFKFIAYDTQLLIVYIKMNAFEYLVKIFNNNDSVLVSSIFF